METSTYSRRSSQISVPSLIRNFGIVDGEFLFARLAEYMASSAFHGNDRTAHSGQ